MVKQELKENSVKLANAELEETEEAKLIQEILDKKAIKKKHESEIKKLETQTNITVDYTIVKSGLTAVLPPGLTLKPEFLPEPVCWCPHNFPVSYPIEEKTPMRE